MNVRLAPKVDKQQIVSVCLLCANVYGPAVRYKMNFQDQRT